MEHLPFPDASFDTAVVAQVLCSVPDQQAALEEIARVLRINATTALKLARAVADAPVIDALDQWLTTAEVGHGHD